MPKDKARQRSMGVDLNILPEHMRPPRLEFTLPSLGGLSITFWLLFTLAALLLIPLSQFRAQAQTELERRQTILQILEAEVQRRKALPAELEKTKATISQTLQTYQGLEADYRAWVVGKTFWADVLESILQAKPQGISLTSITQKGNQITLNGTSDSQATVSIFANNLKQTGHFANVTIQSLTEQRPVSLPPRFWPPAWLLAGGFWLGESATPEEQVPLPQASPTAALTATPAPTPTFTPTATAISTPTPTPTPTNTPTATNTPTTTPTNTPTPTPTPIVSAQIWSARFSPQRLTVGTSNDLLQVEVAVRNVGEVALPSQGPLSFYTYDEGESFYPNWPEQCNRFRVGVDYQGRTQTRDHPYRWGWSGSLAPGESITVTGYIRVSKVSTRFYWVGLVQECVGWLQDREGLTKITVELPTPTPTATPTGPGITPTVTPTAITTPPTATPSPTPVSSAAQGKVIFTIVLELKGGR